MCRAPLDSSALVRALSELAVVEQQFTKRFYEIFFELRPDTRALFGVHSLSEQEEMVRETLQSLHALGEGAPWLAENLDALGSSHDEYGVTPDMYPVYVDAVMDCAKETLGGRLDDDAAEALRSALKAIADRMAATGQTVDADA